MGGSSAIGKNRVGLIKTGLSNYFIHLNSITYLSFGLLLQIFNKFCDEVEAQSLNLFMESTSPRLASLQIDCIVGLTRAWVY